MEGDKTMRKIYAPPSVEKIAFRYRDQIVAASGDSGSGGAGDGDSWNDTLGRLVEAVGVSGCDEFFDQFG